VVAVVVYVCCAQSSLSGDRACMNESAVESCAACTRYTRQRPWGRRVSGRLVASVALGGIGPDRGWGGPEKRRRRWRIKWVGEQRPRFPPLACPIDRAHHHRRRWTVHLDAAAYRQHSSDRARSLCACVFALTTSDWWTEGRKSAR
jgi:hypothetical protein